MTPLYFAYGSNMSRARLRRRIPAAESVGAARLREHALRMNKRGADGSAKANLVSAREEWVWGVLYRLPDGSFDTLDHHERGYVRFAVEVEDRAGDRVAALAYRSERWADDPAAFDWYRRHMLEGAREHGLPTAWIRVLEAITVRGDPRGSGDASGQ